MLPVPGAIIGHDPQCDASTGDEHAEEQCEEGFHGSGPVAARCVGGVDLGCVPASVDGAIECGEKGEEGDEDESHEYSSCSSAFWLCVT